MEYTTTPDSVIETDNWSVYREEAKTCQHFDLQTLIDRVVHRWHSASTGFRAMAYAQLDRVTHRKHTQSLRGAEQAIFAVATATFPFFKEGYTFRLDDLLPALLECRMLIVLPVAKRMAEHDEAGRSVDEIAVLLAQEAQFIDGRAVIDQTLAGKLPSPYGLEAPNA